MQKCSPLLLLVTIGTLAINSFASEKWASSNQQGTLGNICEVHYKLPDGFTKSEELTAKQNALAILMRKNGDRSQFIAIDFKPINEAAKDFESYRKNEIEFIKQHKVYVDVEILSDEHFVKNEQETVYEKWASSSKSKFKVYKKVYRIKKPDGYYSVSINADNIELLTAYPFEEYLKSVSLTCLEKIK